MNVTDALVNRGFAPVPVLAVVAVAPQPHPAKVIVAATASTAFRILVPS
jgi:hypothetical protein